MVQTLASLLVVIGVALVIGFRTSATALEWLAVLGVLALIAFALTWLTVAIGVVSTSVEEASNLPMPLLLLPFLSSAFVPTESMPTVVRWFAEYQPFTPFIETIRGLLLGTPIGSSAVATVAWCGAITAVGYLWATRQYDRRSVS